MTPIPKYSEGITKTRGISSDALRQRMIDSGAIDPRTQIDEPTPRRAPTTKVLRIGKIFPGQWGGDVERAERDEANALDRDKLDSLVLG